MPDTFEKSFVRIRSINQTTAGAGFMIDKKHIVTCAHVVQYALALKDGVIPPVNAKIQVEFPFILPVKKLSFQVVRYEANNDIAILELLDSLPVQACPAPIAMTNNLTAHSFRVYGYPEHYNEMGVWAYGEIRDALESGIVQLQIKELTGETVKKGFSGGPVWDDQLQQVVGMIAVADKAVRLAFMIPSQTLATVWEISTLTELGKPRTISIVTQMKIKKIEDENALIIKQYEATSQQLLTTLDPASKIIFEEKLAEFERKLRANEAELDKLKA